MWCLLSLKGRPNFETSEMVSEGTKLKMLAKANSNLMLCYAMERASNYVYLPD
jgi:hypothetical protein